MASDPRTQIEVKSHLTQRFVYDPIKVNAVYKALRQLDVNCLMEFANYDDEARAQEVFEALYECQVFHDLFYAIGDEGTDYGLRCRLGLHRWGQTGWTLIDGLRCSRCGKETWDV